MDDERETSLENVAGDGFAHQTETNVSDFQHVFLLGNLRGL